MRRVCVCIRSACVEVCSLSRLSPVQGTASSTSQKPQSCELSSSCRLPCKCIRRVAYTFRRSQIVLLCAVCTAGVPSIRHLGQVAESLRCGRGLIRSVSFRLSQSARTSASCAALTSRTRGSTRGSHERTRKLELRELGSLTVTLVRGVYQVK